MDIPIALLLPVPNLIVQILLVLALSLLWCTFISTPFGVQEYVRTPFPLRAFFRYLMQDNIEYIELTQNILNIPIKRTKNAVPEHLTVDGLELLLN